MCSSFLAALHHTYGMCSLCVFALRANNVNNIEQQVLLALRHFEWIVEVVFVCRKANTDLKEHRVRCMGRRTDRVQLCEGSPRTAPLALHNKVFARRTALIRGRKRSISPSPKTGANLRPAEW